MDTQIAAVKPVESKNTTGSRQTIVISIHFNTNLMRC